MTVPARMGMRTRVQGELLQAGACPACRGEGVLPNDPGADQRRDPESRHECEASPHARRGRMRGAGPDNPATDSRPEVIQRPDQGGPQDPAVCSAMDLDELLLAESLAEEQDASMERRIEAHAIGIARAPDTVEMKVRIEPRHGAVVLQCAKYRRRGRVDAHMSLDHELGVVVRHMHAQDLRRLRGGGETD